MRFAIFQSTFGDFARLMTKQMTRNLATILLLPLCCLFAQKAAFDVISIKVNKSGSSGGSLGPRGGSLFVTNLNLRALLTYAYKPASGNLRDTQLIGLPAWAATDRYDIEAKPESGVQNRPMMQSLLEERFQLKAHLETRDLPVYDLVLTREGPKLSADQTPPDPRQSFLTVTSQSEHLSPLPRGAIRKVTGPVTTLTGTAVSIPLIISLLQPDSDRIIIDKTGFTSLIDVHLEFSTDLAGGSDPSNPSIFGALRDIGLKLEPAKAPLDVLVVESVQHPTDN
jgi:uncharacterized protein (TIGR03435 family)